MKLKLLGDHILAQKVETKTASQYELAGKPNNGPFYNVCFAGDSTDIPKDQYILLVPGTYENLIIDGQTYIYLKADSIMGYAPKAEVDRAK